MTSRCKKWVISAHKADVHSNWSKSVPNWLAKALLCKQSKNNHQLVTMLSFKLHLFLHSFIHSFIYCLIHPFYHFFIHLTIPSFIAQIYRAFFKRGFSSIPTQTQSGHSFGATCQKLHFQKKRRGYKIREDTHLLQISLLCTIFTDICHGTHS